MNLNKPSRLPGRHEIDERLWDRFVHLLESKHSKEIRLHLWTLWQIAGECSTITEFGVKRADSTTAFLAAGVDRLISVDLRREAIVDVLFEIRGETEFVFVGEDCRYVEIPMSDFLFIDSTHTGQHLRVELEKHADKVNRFLGFHDTVSAGSRGFFYRSKDKEKLERHGDGVSIGDRGWKIRGEGLMPVIHDFLDANNQWSVLIDDRRSNGLIILEKKAT